MGHAEHSGDLSKGILEAIDMVSYRVEKKAAVKIQLPDSDAEIEPVPTTGGGHMSEPELDGLSNISKCSMTSSATFCGPTLTECTN